MAPATPILPTSMPSSPDHFDSCVALSTERTPAVGLIADRRERVQLINAAVQEYFTDGNLAPVEHLLGVTESSSPQVWHALVFALEAFRTPRGDKLTRKDGSPIVSHSVELMQKARSFGIVDADVYSTALLHDTLEDTLATPEQVLELGARAGSEALPAFVRTFTEQRSEESTDREHELVSFICQLQAAEGVPEERRHVVQIVELLDRIDDLSDLDYLVGDLAKPEKADKARGKLAEKLAKCRFTVEALTDGSTDESVQMLRASFDALAAHVEQANAVPADQIEIQRAAYETVLQTTQDLARTVR